MKTTRKPMDTTRSCLDIERMRSMAVLDLIEAQRQMIRGDLPRVLDALQLCFDAAQLVWKDDREANWRQIQWCDVALARMKPLDSRQPPREVLELLLTEAVRLVELLLGLDGYITRRDRLKATPAAEEGDNVDPDWIDDILADLDKPS